MNYPELREAMDHDAEDLRHFAQVLERELNAAATELGTALAKDDTEAVGDIKHKLKTSLQLLEAKAVQQDLASITETLRAGKPVPAQQKSRVVANLRQLAKDLAATRW